MGQIKQQSAVARYPPQFGSAFGLLMWSLCCACQEATAQWWPLVNPNPDDISAEPPWLATLFCERSGNLVWMLVVHRGVGLANHTLTHLEITSPPDCPIAVDRLARFVISQEHRCKPWCACMVFAARHTNEAPPLQMRCFHPVSLLPLPWMRQRLGIFLRLLKFWKLLPTCLLN